MFLLRHTERNCRWIKYIVAKRGKKKAAAITNVDRALKYFDSSYAPIYGTKWSDIKKALFYDKKYAALVNMFSVTEPTIKRFEELGAYNIGEFYTKSIKRYDKSSGSSDGLEDMEASNENIEIRTSERPKLYSELTDEEKAIEAAKPPLSSYPEEYKQRLAAAGHDVDIFTENMSDRVIKGGNFKDSQLLSMQNYIPATKLKGLEDWIEETDVFVGATEEDSQIGIKKVRDPNPIQWPENIKLYSFIRGDFRAEFPEPSRCSELNIMTHFLMGGASVLPVLALDVKRGENVLDLCSAPGGKSLAILQTMMPDELVCCDVKQSRVARIQKIMEEYIPQELDDIWDIVQFKHKNGCFIDEPNFYDKVLVDVPCLDDRHSLHESDNSIFKTTRVNERLTLPELQAELLFAALSMCRPGGSVVYSTCTLSPLQNDGVVRLALSKIWKTTRIECNVVDLENTLKHLKFSFKFGSNLGLRYGHIVVPSVDENFGPMYFAKIDRVK